MTNYIMKTIDFYVIKKLNSNDAEICLAIIYKMFN